MLHDSERERGASPQEVTDESNPTGNACGPAEEAHNDRDPTKLRTTP